MTIDLSQRKLGLAAALSSYVIWGAMSIYYSWLTAADPWEVVAHRVLWSLLFVPLWLLVNGRLPEMLRLGAGFFRNRREVLVLLTAAGACALNWFINVYAVMSHQVVELGIWTFLTPIISVSLGVLIYKESLSRVKKAGVLLAALGVMVMIAGFGQIPWVALGVSMSWGVYGALKKAITLPAQISIVFEGLLMMPFAAAYLVWLSLQGQSHFSLSADPVLSLALLGTGIAATIPMILFSKATQLLPMAILGFCQYLAPVLTLLIGIFFFGEGIGAEKGLSLAFILAGIVTFSVCEVKELAAAKSI